MQIFWYILFGVIGGIFAGMGMGGGTLLIPLLVIFLDFAQLSAQGLNLISFLILSIFAIFIHIKNKLVNFKVFLIFAIFGVLGSVGGSLLTTIISSQDLKLYYGTFLLIIGVFQFASITQRNYHKSKITR